MMIAFELQVIKFYDEYSKEMSLQEAHFLFGKGRKVNTPGAFECALTTCGKRLFKEQ